jgi:hypothetical protein
LPALIGSALPAASLRESKRPPTASDSASPWNRHVRRVKWSSVVWR